MTVNKSVVQETLRLIGVVENQSRELMAFCQDSSNSSPHFQDYKRFVEKIEHFYVFVDLVEGRIPEFDIAKREPLNKHLSKIRWKVIILELDTTRIYLVKITQSGRKLPLGAREFLVRRLERLSEISQYYDRFGEEHELAPPAQALIEAVEKLLRAGIEQAPRLEEFTNSMPSVSLPRPSATPMQPTMAPASSYSISESIRLDPARMRQPLLPVVPEKVNVKETWGRFYVEKGSLVAVSQACKVASISIDQLANRLGLSRVALSLMLSGQDPMPRQAVDKLQLFMGEQARRVRPER
ncbi:hypothetical protein [Ferrovibrio sp.]|uniref:hypothetical protein n=1 Tax=Ferrovibrio sp. TaxID=1917215 RepID=UPI003D14B6AD